MCLPSPPLYLKPLLPSPLCLKPPLPSPLCIEPPLPSPSYLKPLLPSPLCLKPPLPSPLCIYPPLPTPLVSQISPASPLISQASFALPPCVSSLPCLPPSCLKPSLPSSPLSRASLCTLSCLTPPSFLLFPLSQAFLDLPFLSQTSLSCPPSKASPRSIYILVSHDALSWTLLLHCCYGSVGCCFAWQTLGGS